MPVIGCSRDANSTTPPHLQQAQRHKCFEPDLRKPRACFGLSKNVYEAEKRDGSGIGRVAHPSRVCLGKGGGSGRRQTLLAESISQEVPLGVVLKASDGSDEGFAVAAGEGHEMQIVALLESPESLGHDGRVNAPGKRCL